MAIAPITGKIRKRFWLDVGFALGLGVSSAYAYWYGVHLKAVAKNEEYYLKLERQRAEAS